MTCTTLTSASQSELAVRRDGTRPGFWDVRPTRADRSTATKLRVLTPLKDGSAVYLRYPWDRGEKPLPKFQVLRPLHFPLPTVPHRPTGGTVAIRPTFRIAYSLRDRPDGTPRARDRFPPRGNTLGRLSLAQGRPVRPHTRTRPYTHTKIITQNMCRTKDAHICTLL